MKRNIMYLSILGAVCVVLAVLTAFVGQAQDTLSLITQPVILLGQGLRTLSLSGWAGNLLAWLLFVALSLLPALPPLLRKIKKQALRLSDAFWLGASALLFGLLYLMINPGLAASLFNQNFDASALDMELMVLVIAWLSAIFAAVVLRLLEAGNGRGLATKLHTAILVVCGVLIASICYINFVPLLKAIASFTGGLEGTIYSAMGWDVSAFSGADALIALLRFLADTAPLGILIAALIPLSNLFENLDADDHAGQNIKYAARAFALTKLAIMVTVIGRVGFNLLQLLLARSLNNVNFQLDLPFFELLLAFVIYFLTSYMTKAKTLSDENAKFI